MNFKQVFAQQIAKGKPCSGDYLTGKTLEAAVDASLMYLSVGGTGIIDNDPLIRQREIERITRKIEEFKKHKGEYLVSAVVINEEQLSNSEVNVKMTVETLWESDWDSFLENHQLSVDGLYPRFNKK